MKNKQIIKKLINIHHHIACGGKILNFPISDSDRQDPHTAIFAMGFKPLTDINNRLIGVAWDDGEWLVDETGEEFWDSFMGEICFDKTELLVLKRAGIF